MICRSDEEEMMFGGKMSEVAAFLRDINEGEMFDLMKELLLIGGAEKVIDMKLAASEALV